MQDYKGKSKNLHHHCLQVSVEIYLPLTPMTDQD